MKNAMVIGNYGKMGRILCNLIQESSDFHSYLGLDPKFLAANVESNVEYCFCTLVDSRGLDGVDVIIDFSRPSATMQILPLAVERRIPMVIATTGFSEGQEVTIKGASRSIPIFKSANMGLGTRGFVQIVKYAVATLPSSYKISIHEIHHCDKKDAPSGTAKMLFNEITEARQGTLKYRFDSDGKIGENEVWISSERNENFCGEHTVTIGGKNEYFRFTHSVRDRAVFAEGALEAARFIMQQAESRIYTMDDLFNE